MTGDFNQSGADFSPCRRWRYVLWRSWHNPYKNVYPRKVAFIGLNPSTADETTNDPTVTRCINFAQQWEYDGMFMLNAFAYRATDPAIMKAQDDPVGLANDDATSIVCSEASLIVACWGNHGAHLNRDKTVLNLPNVKRVHCLGVNKTGQPKHPLYLAKDTKPVLMYVPKS